MRVVIGCKDGFKADALDRLLTSQGWAVSHFAANLAEVGDLVLIDCDAVEAHVLADLSRRSVVVLMGPPSQKSVMVAALDHGASDFLLTPLDPREVCARLHVIARGIARTRAIPVAPAAKALQLFDYTLDEDRSGLAGPSGPFVALSHKEFEILRVLFAAPERIHSRATLLDRAYGIGTDVSDRTVDYHICKIRKKLEQKRTGLVITTRRGQGYVLEKQTGAA